MTRAETWRHVADASPDGIVILDGDGVVRFANAQAGRLFGVPSQALVGIDSVGLVPADTAERASQIWLEFQTDPGGPTQTFRQQLRTDDGSSRWVDVQLNPGADGLAVVHLRDVTSTVELVRIAAHSQQNAVAGQHAQQFAHDLNGLLSVIMGSTEMLLLQEGQEGGHPSSSERRERTVANLERSLDACVIAGDLSRSLLPFSWSVVADQRRSAVEVIHAAGQAVRLAESLLPPSIRLELFVDNDAGDPLLVWAEPVHIQQMLSNLIINARHAVGESGSITVRVAAAVLARGDDATPDAASGPHVMIAVADDGAGMTAEVRARAFEAFFTTRPRTDGSGLGLAIVERLVDEARGHIAVDTAPGRGTTFTIGLPRYFGPLAEPQALGGSQEPIHRFRGSGEHIHVRVADLGFGSFLRDMLTQLGYRVSGEPDTARAGEVDLLVVESDLIAGSDPTSELAALAQTTSVLLIDDPTPDHDDGADRLVKPFGARALGRAVADTLARRRTD